MSTCSPLRRVDVAIVGAGPAGMFVARRLLSERRDMAIALIDKGKPAHLRSSAHPFSQRNGWDTHDIISGVGGAGLFSDGKLVLTLSAGGNLTHGLWGNRQAEYVRYVEQALLQSESVSARCSEKADPGFIDTVQKHGLSYKHLPVRHFGTSSLLSIIEGITGQLLSCPKVTLHSDRLATSIEKRGDSFVVETMNPAGGFERVSAKNVVFAVGKEGSPWLADILRPFGVKSSKNRIYFGVRMEAPATEALSKFSFDPKLSTVFEDGTKIKTHCFCTSGKILPLRYFGLPLAGSHTPDIDWNCGRNKENTVLGILLGDSEEAPVSSDLLFEMMATVKAIGKGRLLAQRLGDFRANRASTRSEIAGGPVRPSVAEFMPGNLRELRLPLSFDAKLLDFVERLGALAPSLSSDGVILYAPAVEWWMPRIETDATMETVHPGLYVAGDGAGVSQGIMYAAATGVLVADSILTKIGQLPSSIHEPADALVQPVSAL